ncbi:hypothetical protein GGR50DRAFT_677918 [Xylaria sp. CBS 124048]|nr:hypothetical protein GGR50DRAFT_677918 [Xylaria sp. CBS 124048]
MPRAKAKMADIVDQESDNPFVTDNDPKPNRKQPRRKKNRLSRLEEYDEDPGRDGSKKYQRLAKMLESCTTQETGKTKAFLREFRKNVTKQETELKAFRKKKELEFTKSQEKIDAILKEVSQELDGGQLGALRKEDHPLFQQARTNTEDYRSLIERFELMEEQLKGNKLDVPVARWKQDKQEIKELLVCGGRYGETMVGSALAPGSAGVGQLDASEENRFARELFRDCQETLDGETWGDVAESQLKQFSFMAKTMSPENEFC